jgi:hypothetical protein
MMGGVDGRKLNAYTADGLAHRYVEKFDVNTTAPVTASVTTSAPVTQTTTYGISYTIPTSIAIANASITVAFPSVEDGLVTDPVSYTFGETSIFVQLPQPLVYYLPLTSVNLSVNLSIPYSSINSSTFAPTFISLVAEMLAVSESRLINFTVSTSTPTQSSTSVQSLDDLLATPGGVTVSGIIGAIAYPAEQPSAVVATSIEALILAQTNGLIALPGVFAYANSVQVSLVALPTVAPSTPTGSGSATKIGLGVGLGLGGGLILSGLLFVAYRSHRKLTRPDNKQESTANGSGSKQDNFSTIVVTE